MAKKLKEFSIFSGKKYYRDNLIYSRKEDAIKEAKKLKKIGINVVRDKNSKGHFLWTSKKIKNVHMPLKSTSKSKPRMTKKSLLGILKKDIKEWEPSGSYSDKGKIYIDEKFGDVEIDFRDLGRWKSNEEDDDFPEWSDKSYDKYAKEFSNWAKRKPWYKRVETSVNINEKAWASFSLTIKKNKK